MLKKKTIEDVDISGKRVIARVDFNVPIDDNGNITDDLRIRAALPTIEYVLSKGASLILMSHRGRPKGEPDPKFSLKPVYQHLKSILDAPVAFVSDCVGEDTAQKAADLKPGEVLLLENLRFHAGEKENDSEFAEKLAALADVYVNDAFGTAHRAHASTVGITEFSDVAVAGFLFKKEIDYFQNALANPQRPFIALLGGAKVSDKILVIEHLMDKVDTIIIGGGMSYTFQKARGHEIGTSICEDDRVEKAKELMQLAIENGVDLLLPDDVVGAAEFSENAEHATFISGTIPKDWMGMDIGMATRKVFAERISKCKTIVWNGPVGVFEFDAFDKGTLSIAQAIADTDCISIVGGGDSAAAIKKMGLTEKFSHISTGGGASLIMLEGQKLPALEALDDA